MAVSPKSPSGMVAKNAGQIRAYKIFEVMRPNMWLNLNINLFMCLLTVPYFNQARRSGLPLRDFSGNGDVIS